MPGSSHRADEKPELWRSRKMPSLSIFATEEMTNGGTCDSDDESSSFLTETTSELSISAVGNCSNPWQERTLVSTSPKWVLVLPMSTARIGFDVIIGK